MARMPAAEWVGEQSPRNPMDRYDIVCIHTIVGYAPAHAAHFSVAGNGKIYQSRDTAYQSAANLNGNHRVIAIENADHGAMFPSWNVNDGHAVPGFTDAQVESIARILAWAHETHGVPLQLCPNSKPRSRGLAYHRQGIDGNFGDYQYPGRVDGGEVWTSSYGKVCPGDRRISARKAIVARARQIAEGDDMANAEQVLERVNALMKVFTDFRDNEAARDKALRARLDRYIDNSYQRERLMLKLVEKAVGQGADDATKQDIINAQKALEAAIEEAHDAE